MGRLARRPDTLCLRWFLLSEEMAKVHGASDFYAQRALLLLSRGGSAAHLRRMEVTDTQSPPILGGGAHRVLHLLLQEHLGFPVKQQLRPEDYSNLAVAEREAWRRAALVDPTEAELAKASYSL